jgi:lipoprotein signal peptidase
MRNWVFIRPLFWKILFFGLLADWGSKGLIDLFIEPIKNSRRPISEFEGMVYPFPPGRLSIAHAEHWHANWYDLSGFMLQIHKFADWIIPFEISMQMSGFAVLFGLPLLVSLYSIGKRRPQMALTLALAFWFIAALGNKGEIWLTGHATDWIWIRIGGLSRITNLADLAAYAGILLLLFALWSIYTRPASESG